MKSFSLWKIWLRLLRQILVKVMSRMINFYVMSEFWKPFQYRKSTKTYLKLRSLEILFAENLLFQLPHCLDVLNGTLHYYCHMPNTILKCLNDYKGCNEWLRFCKILVQDRFQRIFSLPTTSEFCLAKETDRADNVYIMQCWWHAVMEWYWG